MRILVQKVMSVFNIEIIITKMIDQQFLLTFDETSTGK